MADFIALIRRAVDSLSDNTPEMRVRIYDKARAAVLRQLENMQPRPPEEMLRRQLDKLDSAILQVEEEYSEALPAEDIIPPLRFDSPTSGSKPDIIDEPPETYVDDRGVIFRDRQGAEEDHPEKGPDTISPPSPVDVVDDTVWRSADESEPMSEAGLPRASVGLTPPLDGKPSDPLTLAAVPEPDTGQTGQPAWPVDIDEEPAVWAEREDAGIKPAGEPDISEVTVRMPKAGFDEQRALADYGDRLDTGQQDQPSASTGQAESGFSWDAPFDDLPESKTPLAFEQGLLEKQAEIAAVGQSDEATNSNPLADLDDLIGFTRNKGPSTDTKAAPLEVGRSRLEGRSFDIRPKRKAPNVFAIVIAVIVILVLGGGAVGAWYWRDALIFLIDGPPTTIKDSSNSPAKTTPATDADPDGPDVGAVEPTDTGPRKFTQRLLTDGSETLGDSEAVKVDSALGEGRSEAGQTVPSSAEDAPTDTKPVAAASVSAEKMLLYEERLGQTSPTALTGSVVWRIKNDSVGGAKPEPVIEGEIEVPERGIKALITAKRNTDTSLPASHIIEIVFSLPNDFEGGNIESVERIALKQTEQERGNALIAVPAKITDDFHMIALNDEKEALANNLELLRSREWIDIPITYRNGRRALMSLDKGETGKAVFQKAMTEWTALGRGGSN